MTDTNSQEERAYIAIPMTTTNHGRDEKYGDFKYCCNDDADSVILVLPDNDEYDEEVDWTVNLRRAKKREQEKRLGSLKFISFILGMVVGFFLQFSTLGANFVLTQLFGGEIVMGSKRGIFLFSMTWSLVTSGIAILILGFLRSLVNLTFDAAAQNQQQQRNVYKPTFMDYDGKQRLRDNSRLLEVTLNLEYRFIIGALVGVCSAWTATDIVLGMNLQVFYSGVTLLCALLWCRIMSGCFVVYSASPAEDDDDSDDDLSEDADDEEYYDEDAEQEEEEDSLYFFEASEFTA